VTLHADGTLRQLCGAELTAGTALPRTEPARTQPSTSPVSNLLRELSSSRFYGLTGVMVRKLIRDKFGDKIAGKWTGNDINNLLASAKPPAHSDDGKGTNGAKRNEQTGRLERSDRRANVALTLDEMDELFPITPITDEELERLTLKLYPLSIPPKSTTRH
jgi:hypothetical protein